MHEAKTSGAAQVEIWGSGTPLREFLHVDDLASACIFLMQNYNEELFVNVGFGEDVSIRELAELIRDVVGFEGELVFDSSKPDGTPRKLMDSGRILSMGWKPQIGLREGVSSVYREMQSKFSRFLQE
jgi:GDP-L-fucose synthase